MAFPNSQLGTFQLGAAQLGAAPSSGGSGGGSGGGADSGAAWFMGAWAEGPAFLFLSEVLPLVLSERDRASPDVANGAGAGE